MKLLTMIVAMLLLSLSVEGGCGERDVIRRDKELNALIARNDSAAAAAYYHDQFVLTVSSGAIKRKADMLREIGDDELKFELNDTRDIAVRVHHHTAVVTGILHQRGSYKGRVFDVRLRVTDTWVRNNDGEWVILAGHASIREPQ